MKTSHLFPLSEMEPQKKSAGGYRLEATKRNFSVLEGMSFYKVLLEPQAIREPHWHANADEIGYCVKGKILISFFATGNRREHFLVYPGESFFIPSGSIHAIENVSDDESVVILAFSHEEPEDFALSSTFGMFTDAVLGNTWGVSSGVFLPLKRSLEEIFITSENKAFLLGKDLRYPSPYKYNLEGAFPLVGNSGGKAKVARKNVWPILNSQALYSLHLTGEGMREPHWHPETREMGYVNSGKGRMSILSPNGHLDTYEMREGDIYFIPKAYPHHIENLNQEEELHLLIFFDQSMPKDIGFTASVKSFSSNLLDAVLNKGKPFFEKLPTYFQDLFIVKKVNPVDKNESKWSSWF